MKIAILDDWSGSALGMADWARLKTDLGAAITVFTAPFAGPAAVIAALQPFDVVCLMRERTPFPADVIAALPALRLIVTTGPRNLSIDVVAARTQGVTVCGTRGRKTTTSELTLALILAQSRHVVDEATRLAGGGFQGAPGRDLAGLRLGIVGLGSIGQQMAALAHLLGMDVAAWSPNLTADRCAAAGVTLAPSLTALATMSDVLTVHMVLSDRTRGLIGADAFNALPPGALVLNTSRAGLLDRVALFDWLRRDPTARAGIDVFETEPLPADDPWRAALPEFGPRLLLTPHLGYVTDATWRLFYQDTVDAIAAFAAGQPIRLLEGH